MANEETLTYREEYLKLLERPKRIFEIFSDYFGEDKVDFDYRTLEQEYYNIRSFCSDFESATRIFSERHYFQIYVWFPEITVTNEFNESINIQDLYAEVNIEYNGSMKGYFLLNRTTFPIEQFLSDYSHSHLPGINYEFMTPCLGSGPIKITIGNLNNEFDEDLWELFCSELDDYVRVESIKGGPYRRLQNVSITQNKLLIDNTLFIVNPEIQEYYPDCASRMLKDFTRYLLKNKLLPISYTGEEYIIGMSNKDFLLKSSYLFIEWYNREDNPYRKAISLEDLIDYDVLISTVMKNSILYSVSRDITQNISSDNRYILTFKGQNKYLKIIQGDFCNNILLVLDPYILKIIISSICKTLNFRYGTSKNTLASGSEPVHFL